jgi:hypothetical protein
MTEETTAASLTRLFKGPAAKMGTTWTDTVTTGWTEASLHHLVMTKGTLSTAKTKDMYGHVRTKTQMRGITGSPYWTPKPLDEMAS